MVCLIKPQFESSPKLMRKNKGVIRDEESALAAVEKIRDYVCKNQKQLEIIGTMQSPIKGGDGNVEYLIGLRKIDA